MNNKEIIKQNKTFLHKNENLLKFSKKQVDDFDNDFKDVIKEKNFLLKGRKWKLIGDTYYEIPKKLSFTWFRNLHKGYLIATCVLLGGAITAAVAVPTVIAIENAKNKHIVKEITYCSFKYGSNKTTGHFFSKNPYVFYVPVTEYNDYAPDSSMRVLDVDDDYVELKNLISCDPSKKATLNMKTGELTYSSYSYFTDTSNNKDCFPHHEIYYANSKDAGSRIIKEGHSYTINLSDYNLNPIKDNNVYYIPMDVMMLIDPTLNPSTAYVSDGDIVQVVDSTLPIVGTAQLTHPASFYNWCYDLFTFNIDLNFGLSGFRRYQRNNDSYFTFNKEGARKTFEPYRSQLVNAKSIEEFDITFDKMISEQLDDGGHSVVYYPSFTTDINKLPDDFAKPKENLYTGKKLEEEKNKRKDKADLSNSYKGYDADGDGINDIGYLCIDGFNVEAARLLKDANNEFNINIKTDSGIKDVVIDIANNGGGSVGAEGMLLSWICGGTATQVIKDAHDESIIETKCNYDINDDKTYDEKDYLPKDVNIYVLTDASFSAACALAFDAYMYSIHNNKKITFIGQPHLGGACSVTGVMMSPTGFGYRLSSTAVGVNWDYDYILTCDEKGHISDNWSLTLDQIVDRDYINNKILAARS